MTTRPEMTFQMARNIALRDFTEVPHQWMENAESMYRRALHVLLVAHTELCVDHDVTLDRVDELSDLLRDLLNDCDNWGVAPDDRYREALG